MRSAIDYKSLLILTRSLPIHRIGGMETQVWALLPELAKRGFQVEVITTELPAGVKHLKQPDGVKITCLPNTEPGLYSRGWWVQSRAYLGKLSPVSVGIVMSVSAAARSCLKLQQLFPGTPWVFQAHGTARGEIISKLSAPSLRAVAGAVVNTFHMAQDIRSYKRYDAIVAVGQKVLEDLYRFPFLGRVPSGSVRFIRNGVDVSRFSYNSHARCEQRNSLGLGDNTFVVLSLCRLHAQKGIANALRGYARLVAQIPDSVFVMAGNGPERDSLKALAARLGLAQRLICMDEIENEAVGRLLSAADVMIFLTQREEAGTPLVLLESAASGLPAITSPKAMALQGSHVSTVDPCDDEQVAAQLASRAKSRLTAARDSYLPEDFSLAHSARQYADLFCELLERKRLVR